MTPQKTESPMANVLQPPNDLLIMLPREMRARCDERQGKRLVIAVAGNVMCCGATTVR